jgi:hypothetical protein
MSISTGTLKGSELHPMATHSTTCRDPQMKSKDLRNFGSFFFEEKRKKMCYVAEKE